MKIIKLWKLLTVIGLSFIVYVSCQKNENAINISSAKLIIGGKEYNGVNLNTSKVKNEAKTLGESYTINRLTVNFSQNGNGNSI